MFKLKFNTVNDAFLNGNYAKEIARILADVAAKVASGQRDGIIRDINGNKVGEWEALT
jgi:hypothetical protein